MDLSQLIPLVASLASAIAAILAWIAKIRWSDEYSKAKDETIKSKDTLIAVKDAQLQTLITNKDEIIKAKDTLISVKDAELQALLTNKDEIIKTKDEQIKVLEREIKSLNDLTPMKIREYFKSVKEQLEEYNGYLQKQVDEAKTEIVRKNEEISKLESTGNQKEDELERLRAERDKIESLSKSLEQEVQNLRQEYEGDNAMTIKMPRITFDNLSVITELSKQLSESASFRIDWGTVTKSLTASILRAYTRPLIGNEALAIIDEEILKLKDHDNDDLPKSEKSDDKES